MGYRIILLLSAVFMLHAVRGEDKFLVYQIKGNVFQGSRSAANNKLRIGQLLKANSEIFLDRNAAVVLLCDNYKPITITRQGIVHLAGWVQDCAQKANSISASYFRYVWNEFTHAHTAPESNRKKYMRNVGGAVRGCKEFEFLTRTDSLLHYNVPIVIKWKTPIPSDRQELRIYDRSNVGLLLASRKLANNSFSADSLMAWGGDHEELYWTIAVDDIETCERNLFLPKQKETYEIAIAQAAAETEGLISEAEMLFITGFYLENSLFLGEALFYYKKAMAKDKNNNRYRNVVKELSAQLD